MCPICKRDLSLVGAVTDHEHRPKWKKLTPEQRARTVRGICCRNCNHRVIGRLKLSQARAIVEYLERYENVKGN